MHNDIDSLSKKLSAVDLQGEILPTFEISQPSRATRSNKSITAVKPSGSKVRTTATSSTIAQRIHQDPLIVRRSRRGDRAISSHPQIGQYCVEITSSEHLWCGKFALVISTEQQLGIRLTVEDFDEIFAGEESRAFNEEHGWCGDEEVAGNFYDEQLDFVLRVWGRRHGLSLQLGVVRDFEGVFVNRPPKREAQEGEVSGECTTLWIHNDNATLLGRPFNHYSGISVLENAC
ncbi:unnamed protein product [Discula destructiva]